eukprot:Skav204867  [mRNA]  locus=scaffold1679:51291:62242:- [translate_table: standard]
MWLADTTGPPRSVEWSWDNREGYREEIDSLVCSELEEFCKEARGICEELFDERSGDQLEALSQLTVHVPLPWMTTKDIFAAFEGLRAVKAFGERSADEGQAIAALMELVSTDPDFGTGENFWRSIYRLWLSSYARMLNSDFQTKVRQLVVTVQGGQLKTYDAIKAAERKLGGSCNPETQAAKLLDMAHGPADLTQLALEDRCGCEVECDILANCPAAVRCPELPHASRRTREGPAAGKAAACLTSGGARAHILVLDGTLAATDSTAEVPFELVRVRSNFSGNAKDDLIMGERAAARANKALDKISGMYMGKNLAVSRAVGDSLEKVVVAVVPGGAGEAALVKEGQVIFEINGREMMESLPEMEVEELMQQRPLQLHVGSVSTPPRAPRLCDTVRQKGVAKFSSALSEQTAQELLKFAHIGHDRIIGEATAIIFTLPQFEKLKDRAGPFLRPGNGLGDGGPTNRMMCMWHNLVGAGACDALGAKMLVDLRPMRVWSLVPGT